MGLGGLDHVVLVQNSLRGEIVIDFMRKLFDLTGDGGEGRASGGRWL